jgi:PmbA protein
MDNKEIVNTVKSLVAGRVDSFDIFISGAKGTSIEIKEQAVESFKNYETHGLSLRVLKDFRPGFSFSSSYSPEALQQIVDDAVAQTSHLGKDELLSFPEGGKREEDGLSIFDPSLPSIGVQEKIKMTADLENAARSYNPKIKKVRGATYGEVVQDIELYNSAGSTLTSSSTRVSVSLMAIAEDGKTSQSGWDSCSKRLLKDLDVEKVGREAARKALELLNAKTIKSVKVPVLLDNAVVIQLLGVLTSSFLGDSVEKGKSMLREKIGEKVFSSKINIVDNGILQGGWATAPFDGEGMPTQKTDLIKAGICTSFLYDTYWGKRAGRDSTGNCRRFGFKSPPAVSVSNLYIEKGEKSFAALLKSMDKGIYITEVMGVHTSNPITGDFSLGSMGFWVEKGEKKYPIKGIAIAGNLLELFSQVAGLGEDMKFFGGLGAPSMLVEALNVSGGGA